jgi:glycosyltransferase involved in cell wall biosynthesis
MLRGLAEAHRDVSWLWCYRAHRLLDSFRNHLPQGCSRRPLGSRYAPRADLFHGLNQRLPAAPMRRAVATFHDLFVLTGDYSTREFRERFTVQAREAAQRADCIITVSRFTAQQVRDLLGVQEDRIRVVHHGVRIPQAGPAAERKRVVLSVGALQRRKNTARLVEAFERMPAGWRLVLAGSQGYASEKIVARIESSPRRADIELTGYVTPEELADRYRHASIFAFPSLDEGFGMPVLDAMAWGLPVLASNRSALPEVAGDAALLVDPEQVDEIADALIRLSQDEALRLRLTQAGAERAKQFSWEAAVEGTWKVYKELIR